MKITVENLYEHADGGYYCLLSSDAPMKHPVTDDWIRGVIYTGPDGKMRSTALPRWKTRFKPVAELETDDETILSMVRRCNPGDSDYDFMSVFESWQVHEVNLTGTMLELAVGAAMERYKVVEADGSQRLTITTEDLQRVVQNYEIERIAEPHGFTFVMRKSFPESA